MRMDSGSHGADEPPPFDDALDCNHYGLQLVENIFKRRYLTIKGDSTYAQLADTEEDLELVLKEVMPALDPLKVAEWASKLVSLNFRSTNNEAISLALKVMELMPEKLTANRSANPIKLNVETTISELANSRTVDHLRIFLEALSHFGQFSIFHDIPYKLVWPRTYSTDDFAPKFPDIYIRIFGIPGLDVTLVVSRSSNENDKLTRDDIAALNAYFIATRIELNRDCRRPPRFNASVKLPPEVQIHLMEYLVPHQITFQERRDHKGRRFKDWMRYDQTLECYMYRSWDYLHNSHYHRRHTVFHIDGRSRQAAAAAMSRLTHVEISSELMNSAFEYHLSSINNSFGGSLLKNVIGVTVHARLRGATVSRRPHGSFVVDLRADCSKFRQLRNLLILQFGSKPEKDTPNTLTLTCSAVDYDYYQGDQTQDYPAVNFRVACGKRKLNLCFTLALCTPQARPWHQYGQMEQGQIARKYVNAVRKKVYGIVGYGALDSSWRLESKLFDDSDDGGESRELRRY